MEKKPNNQNKKKNTLPLENEWVIKLVNAARETVQGYEDYLLDRKSYSELAEIMTKLRELLPDGCKDGKKKKD